MVEERRERERIRGGPRGGDRNGSLGSGRERVLSSPEWMEPVELRAGERGAALWARWRKGGGRKSSLSLSYSLVEIDARAYFERVLGVVSLGGGGLAEG